MSGKINLVPASHVVHASQSDVILGSQRRSGYAQYIRKLRGGVDGLF